MPYYPEKKPKPSGEEQKQTKMTEKQIRLLRLSVAAFSCFLILYGSVRLILVLRRSERFPEHGPGIAADSQSGRAGNRICSQDTGTDRASIHITNRCDGQSEAGRNVSA